MKQSTKSPKTPGKISRFNILAVAVDTLSIVAILSAVVLAEVLVAHQFLAPIFYGGPR